MYYYFKINYIQYFILNILKNYYYNFFFSADGFKVVCDWARATFSPDGQYIAVGSADGSIFIWNVVTTKIESILKDQL